MVKVIIRVHAGMIGWSPTYTNGLLNTNHGPCYDNFIPRTNRFTINFSFTIKTKVVKIQKNKIPEEGYPCNIGELRTGNEGNKFNSADVKYDRCEFLRLRNEDVVSYFEDITSNSE
jgi:hypothetical protein